MMTILGTIYDVQYYQPMIEPSHSQENVESKKKYGLQTFVDF